MLSKNDLFSHKSSRINLYSQLQKAVVPDVNIYNQAYLQLSRPLLESSIFHPQTKYEIGTYFDLSGELRGQIYCFIDTYGKNLSDDKLKAFKSLFSESMNILIGKIITNLDEQNDIFCNISHPKEIKNTQFNYNTYSLGYNLIHELREFDCRIIINTSQNSLTEV